MPNSSVRPSAFGTSDRLAVKERLRLNEAPKGMSRYGVFTLKERERHPGVPIMRCPWCWDTMCRGWTFCMACLTTFVILGLMEPAIMERLKRHLDVVQLTTRSKAEELAKAHLDTGAQKMNARQALGKELMSLMKSVYRHLRSPLLALPLSLMDVN